MDVVVQRAVGRAHQVNQTGLAKSHCVALCKSTKAEKNSKMVKHCYFYFLISTHQLR